ncbi:Flagellar assembly protein T N-terminal domain-containing protein [Candidatus Magnetomoraceae bacterium gMMP-15]
MYMGESPTIKEVKLMKKNIIKTLYFMVISLSLILSGTVQAKELKGNANLEIVGTGFIKKSDVDKARDDAIRDALAGAVENTISRYFSIDVVVENFQVLSDRIYNPVQKFIKDFKVLAESQSGEFYRVMVRATVSLDGIRNTLAGIGISTTPKKRPGVLFFLSEKNIGQADYSWWLGKSKVPALTAGEKAMSDKMRAKRFKIIRHRKFEKIQDVEAEELTTSVFIAAGKQKGAAIIVLGEIEAHLTPGVMGTAMQSFEAIVNVRAIRVESGVVIAETSQKARAVNSDDRAGGAEAIAKAASLAAEELIHQIESGTSQAVFTSSKVDIIVKGSKNLGNFVAFRKILANKVSGVKSIKLQELKFDLARIEVDFSESAQVLAKNLMLQDFDNLGFGINILEVTDTEISLTIIPEQPRPPRNQRKRPVSKPIDEIQVETLQTD